MAQTSGHVLGGTHHFKTGTTLAINGIRPPLVFFLEFFASIRDIVGGRSAAYEKELRKAKDLPFWKCATKPRISVPARSSESISTMKRSAPAATC